MHRIQFHLGLRPRPRKGSLWIWTPNWIAGYTPHAWEKRGRGEEDRIRQLSGPKWPHWGAEVLFSWWWRQLGARGLEYGGSFPLVPC